MRTLQDGWYVTSDKGPMVAHVPGVVVQTPWDPRMGAPVPRQTPEAPGAVMDTEADTSWVSTDKGKTYVEIRGGVPVNVQYSGTGSVLISTLRSNAEIFTHSWLFVPEPELLKAAKNGAAVPVKLDPEQPTHLFVWVPKHAGGGIAATAHPIRVEADKGYGHIEWSNRTNPRVKHNWQKQGEQWFWRGHQGELVATPAGRPGTLSVVPL